jgi:ribosomal protein S18 acetylase RimI-like enzyme
MDNKGLSVREILTSDNEWILNLLNEHWGSVNIVSRGKIHNAFELPGFIAIQNGKPVGLITYKIDNNQCEIVTLNSLVERMGVGAALIEAIKEKSKPESCSRIWLITTNDNTASLNYYQKRGFQLVTLHKNAIEQSRKLKPQIPELGVDDIPIRDEIELEMIS